MFRKNCIEIKLRSVFQNLKALCDPILWVLIRIDKEAIILVHNIGLNLVLQDNLFTP